MACRDNIQGSGEPVASIDSSEQALPGMNVDDSLQDRTEVTWGG